MNLDHHTSDTERQAHRLRNGILSAAALLAVLLSVVLAVPDLRGVLVQVTDASAGWLLLAVLLELASCLGYVAMVRLVLPHSPARQVRWLGWAEMAFGVLLPLGGAGGLAVGAWAMRAWGIAWPRVANRSAVMFLLPSAVNVVLLALAGIGLTVGPGGSRGGAVYGLPPAAVALATLVFILLLPRLTSHTAIEQRHGPLSRSLRRIGAWVGDTQAILRKPDWRQLGSVVYVILDIAALWACLRSVGITAPLLALVVGYQLGYLANILPVPGGVGVLDGGLVGALLLYGLPAGQTAAAVLIYHAIALMVPTPGGAVAFARLRRAVTTTEKPRVVPAGPALVLRSAAPPETLSVSPT